MISGVYCSACPTAAVPIMFQTPREGETTRISKSETVKRYPAAKTMKSPR